MKQTCWGLWMRLGVACAAGLWQWNTVEVALAQQCTSATSYSWGGTNPDGNNTLDVFTVKSSTVTFAEATGTTSPARLTLKGIPGQFSLSEASLPSTMATAAAADFNKDGFEDFAAAPLCLRNNTSACVGFANSAPSSVYLFMNTTPKTTVRQALRSGGTCGNPADYQLVTETSPSGVAWTRYLTQTVSCVIGTSSYTFKNFEDPLQYAIPQFNNGLANTNGAQAGFALPYPAGQVEPNPDNGNVFRHMYAADFNGDTWPDVMVIGFRFNNNLGQRGAFYYAKIFLNRGASCGSANANPNLCDDGSHRFLTAYNALANEATDKQYMQYYTNATSMPAADYNGDNFADILIGVNNNTANGGTAGKIAKFLNNTSGSQPKLVFAEYLRFGSTQSEILFGAAATNRPGIGRTPSFDYQDIDGDGIRDLVIGSVATSGLRIYPGTATAGVFGEPIELTEGAAPNIIETSFADPPSYCALAAGGMACSSLGAGRKHGYSKFVGGVTAVVIRDMDLDGDQDIVIATDGVYNCSNFTNCAGGGQPASTLYGLYGSTSTNTGRWDGGQVFAFFNNGGVAGQFNFRTAWSMAAIERGYVQPSATNSKDLDLLLAIDYDMLDSTPDLMATDGNDSGTSIFIPNRVKKTQFSECGWVTSQQISLSDIDATEFAARHVQITVDGQGLNVDEQFQLWITSDAINGVDPNNPIALGTWVKATTEACGDGVSPNGSTSKVFCAPMPSATGREIGWAARMCAYDNMTKSPTITDMGMGFTYESSNEAIRGGIIESGGVLYQGAFTTPGLRGKLYAIRADFTTGSTTDEIWEASAKLDARGNSPARQLFSASIPFGVENLASIRSEPLQGFPLVDTQIERHYDQNTSGWQAPTQALAVTSTQWLRSKRFGLTGERSALGAINESTPAVMVPPASLPEWLTNNGLPRALAEDLETKYTYFQQAKQQRPTQLLVGSMSGALHSFFLRAPANSSENGFEAWAYYPNEVIKGAYVDCVASSAATPKVCAATQTNAEPVIKYYVGGAPTLGDVIDPSAATLFKTTAVIGGGLGGKTYSVLELSDSGGYDSLPTGWEPGDAVNGPQPKWQFNPTNDMSILASTFPGQPIEWIEFFGWATHKAVFARVSIAAKKTLTYDRNSQGPGRADLPPGDLTKIQDPFICKPRLEILDPTSPAVPSVIDEPAGPLGDPPTYYAPGERVETIVILAGANFPKTLVPGAPPSGHPKSFIGSAPAGETPMESEIDQWWMMNEGRGVTARRISDGKTMWRFMTICPVSSDPVLFTQTEGDQISRRLGAPGGAGTGGTTADALAVDDPDRWAGFINRMVIFDSCGYGYLINPAVEIEVDLGIARTNPWFTWLNHPSHNTELGAVTGVRSPNCNGAVDPAEWGAWFATARDFGMRKPISGTAAAHRFADTGSRLDDKTFIFVGTGGVDSAGKEAEQPGMGGSTNYVYALDTTGDMGAVSAIPGRATPTLATLHAPFNNSTNPLVHTKVSTDGYRSYGGVIVTPSQAIFSVSLPHTCADDGHSKLISMNISQRPDAQFQTTVSESMVGAVYGSIYGSGDAIYFGTVGGEVKRVGDAATSGTGSGGDGGPQGSGGFTKFGWRQIF